MTLKTEIISCNFVGDFKVGDNLVFNADVLCKLGMANRGSVFNKPIIIQTGSIVEAGLDQIIFRAKNHNREGVPNLSEHYRAQIETKKIEKFAIIIDVLKKYHVLDALGTGTYDELHKLRKYRNKVHIQEDIDIKDVSRDDSNAFSDEVRDWALNLNVRVLSFLSEHLPRPKYLHSYVAPLVVPVQQGVSQSPPKPSALLRVVRYTYSQDGKLAQRVVLGNHLKTRDAALAYIEAEVAKEVAWGIDKDEGRWWIIRKNDRETWILIDE
jgi:hypothetical protein